LIYQTWTIAELNGNGQGFLAKLKGKGFDFFRMPSKVPERTSTAAALVPPSPQDPASMVAPL
jgi:hypothetical protein